MSIDSTRETILQLVRDWIELSTDAPRDKILKQYNKVAKQSKPFILVWITSHFRKKGHDEVQKRQAPDDNLIVQGRSTGKRSSTVQVDGYGLGATEWVECLSSALDGPLTKRFKRKNSIDIRQAGPLSDTTATVANRYEKRVTQDFDIHYAVATPWQDIGRAARGLMVEGGIRATTNNLAQQLDFDDFQVTV